MFFKNWNILQIVKPPRLIEDIKKTDLDEIQVHVKNCLKKTFQLCEFLMDNSEKYVSHVFFTKFWPKYAFYHFLFVQLPANGGVIENAPREAVLPFLPEVTIIKYLLTVKTVVFEDIREFYKKFMHPEHPNIYNGKRYFFQNPQTFFFILNEKMFKFCLKKKKH